MEKFQQQPFNPCLVGEDLEVGCWLEEFVKYEDYSYNYNNHNNNGEYSFPSLEDKMPFLQMLQTIEETPSQQQQHQQLQLPNISFMQESNNYFQLLLSIQHQKMLINNYSSNNIGAVVETVKSESCFKEEVKQPQVLPQQCNNNNNSNNNSNNGNKKGQGGTKRKRKRPVRPTKNQEEVETQRRTHIAVERNRRRQMNDHLNALRSLMPASYVQRGDQASIIGGAIDFVKEMEQLLESLQAQKRMRQQSETENTTDIISASSSTSSSPNFINNMFLTTTTSPFQFRNFSPTNNDEPNVNSSEIRSNANNTEEFSAENRSALADIKVVVIQNHVNLKIQCQRRPGQLLKAIVAFEELRLTILHLNITSLHPLVHYSFNLKIEDDCKLGTADEVVRAVHHIFSLINLS